MDCRLLLMMMMPYWSKDQSMMMTHYDYDVSDRKIRVWWWCFWSKDQNVMMIMIDRSEHDNDDVAADRKVKMLKMLLLIEKSKCWWWCCRSSSQSVAAVEIEDEDYMMLKSFQWLIDVLPWWCWWCSLSLSYYCCCWCCCRIPFSLRGSVEIL